MIKSSGARLHVAGGYLLAALAVSALSLPAVIVLSRLARAVCVFVPALEELLYSPRLFDAASFAFAGALGALSHYYLASLLALYRADRRFRLACAAGGVLVAGLFFDWITGRSRLGSYPLCWLPSAAGALLGARAAFAQAAEQNPWPAEYSGYFPEEA